MYIDCTLNEFVRTYTGVKKGTPDTEEVINYRKAIKFFTKFDMERTIRSLNDEEYEKLLDAMKKHEGWREGREEYTEVKKVLGVHLKKHTVSEFLIGDSTGSEWISKKDAIALAQAGILYAIVVHAKSGEQARYFVEKYLATATPVTSDAEVLRFASDLVKLKGLFIELGVCTGKTINFIAGLNPHQKIYGFDSFEGLPEDWIRDDKVITAGTFGFKNPTLLPPVLHNVELIKGWFNDTLIDFMKTHDFEEPIAFLHIDSDIYSSAATAFKILGDRLKPGTILVFDELYNYPGCENHEFKAFQEFLITSGLKARYLAYNIYHEQVAVQLCQ